MARKGKESISERQEKDSRRSLSFHLSPLILSSGEPPSISYVITWVRPLEQEIAEMRARTRARLNRRHMERETSVPGYQASAYMTGGAIPFLFICWRQLRLQPSVRYVRRNEDRRLFFSFNVSTCVDGAHEISLSLVLGAVTRQVITLKGNPLGSQDVRSFSGAADPTYEIERRIVRCLTAGTSSWPERTPLSPFPVLTND